MATSEPELSVLRSSSRINKAMMVNTYSRKFRAGSCNGADRHLFFSGKPRGEKTMKKLSYVLAALVAIAVGAPTIASATEFGIHVGGDRDYYRDRDYGGPRAEFYEHDRGWHRGWYHHHGDREVIIRRQRL
jgi:hypothetical protein